MRSANNLGGGRFMIERASLAPGHDLHPRHRRHDEVSWLLAWIDLQGLAVWKALGDLDRGELEASASELARRWDWTESKVRRFLKEFEAREEIEWNRGGGAATSRIRILRYDEIRAVPNGRESARGTDTPSDTPSRHPKSPTTTGNTPGDRHPFATNHRHPHFYTEEEEKSGRTREGKKDGPGPVEQRVHTAWGMIREAMDDGHVEALALEDPVAEKAYRRAGGTHGLREARRRRHGLTEFQNSFRRAYHELAGSGGDVDDGLEEVVL